MLLYFSNSLFYFKPKSHLLNKFNIFESIINLITKNYEKKQRFRIIDTSCHN